MPLSETWRNLAELIDEAGDMDARRRLRFAISRVVKDIQVVVVACGRDRLAEVQVNFAGGDARRNYMMIHRPPLWVGTGLRPGRWWCSSVKHPDDRLPFLTDDLRDRQMAEFVAESLVNYPRELVEQLLNSDRAHVID
jgi:hypothetical protein